MLSALAVVILYKLILLTKLLMLQTCLWKWDKQCYDGFTLTSPTSFIPLMTRLSWLCLQLQKPTNSIH